MFGIIEMNSLHSARDFDARFDGIEFQGSILNLEPAESAKLVMHGISKFLSQTELFDILSQEFPDLKSVQILKGKQDYVSEGIALIPCPSFVSAKSLLFKLNRFIERTHFPALKCAKVQFADPFLDHQNLEIVSSANCLEISDLPFNFLPSAKES